MIPAGYQFHTGQWRKPRAESKRSGRSVIDDTPCSWSLQQQLEQREGVGHDVPPAYSASHGAASPIGADSVSEQRSL